MTNSLANEGGSSDPYTVPLTLHLAPDNADALRELIEGNLRRRRAFVVDVENFPPVEAAITREACELIVFSPGGGQLKLDAEIVFVQTEGEGRGVGLTLLATNIDEILQPLVTSCEQAESASVPSFELVAPQASENEASADATAGDVGSAAEDVEREQRQDEPEIEAEAERKQANFRNIHERVRKLTAAERDRMARSGGMTERVALERAFGSVIWEGLLQNPQITGGEVARIAKNGGAPAPTLAIIANNAGWISRGEVRRALLGNPRLGSAVVEKLLRATPKSELKLVVKQAIYPAKIRAIAARLLKRL